MELECESQVHDMWIAKIKLKSQIYIYNGIAKRDHCKVMTRVMCVSGFEKLLSMIHCGHFNDVKYYWMSFKRDEVDLVNSYNGKA